MKKSRSASSALPASSAPSVQVQELKARIRAGVDVREMDKNGVTILHHAVRFRSPEAVRALIGLGANVNQACKRSGSTALHRAVMSTGAPGTAGQTAEAGEIVALLLAAGADPAIRNKKGKTPGEYTSDEAIRRQLAGDLKSTSHRSE